MPDSYVAKPLDVRRIDQAFPVVQTVYPKLGLERWRAYAAEMIGATPDAAGALPGKVVKLPTAQPTGIVTAQLRHGYIHGLFAYAVLPNLCHGKVLQVDLMVAADMFDPAAIAEALLAEMDRLARQLRCDAIHLSLPKPPAGSQYDRILQLGLVSEGVRLCKSLAPAVAAG